MKWLGICLLSLCILGIGSVRCRRWKERYARSCRFQALVRYIKGQIDAFRMPLREIYSGWQEGIDHGRFDEILRKEGLSEALTQAADEIEVPERLLTVMNELSTKLGKSDGEDQVALCERYLLQIDAICEEERAALADRIKVNRTVSLALSVMAAILLL